MAKKATLPLPTTPQRVIALWAGDSSTGKSFAVANLKQALIFDTDLGGGLAYLDSRIERNGSERIEVGSYLDVMEQIRHRRSNGSLKNYTTLAIDHLTTMHQEALLRYNPNGVEDFGKSYEKANREWRKIRDLVRVGDFNLVCTAHLKAKYENQKIVGIVSDAAKNINGDFEIVLYLQRRPDRGYPSVAMVEKWRRDPEDVRGCVPPSFPFTLESFVEMHGLPMEGDRQEIVMATDEQVAKLEHLLAVVKLPEGLADKWLSKAKVESWSEMPTETIGKCIGYLEDQINKTSKPAEAA